MGPLRARGARAIDRHHRVASPHTRARSSRVPSPQLLMEQIEADMEAENPWARVIKLVDLQAEHSDKNLDVSRMRQLFIQLKNEPVVRP